MNEKLLELIAKIVDGYSGPTFAVAICVGLIFNSVKILAFFEAIQSRRKAFLESALKVESLDEPSRSMLNEEINRYYFKKITGITANSALRAKINQLVSRQDAPINIFQLARIRNHLKLNAGKLSITIDKFDYVYAGYNLLLAIPVALLAVSLLLLTIPIKPIDIRSILGLYVSSSLLFCVALFLLAQAIPVIVARRLIPVLKEIETEAYVGDSPAARSQKAELL
jgi:hypothetical protein